MWILAVVAGLVLVLANAMRIEGACSANYLAQQQAAAVESGAIQYVLAHLDGLNGTVPDEAEMPCQGVQVGDGVFWVIRPDPDNNADIAYGVVDEAAKISLNAAPLEVLSELPDIPPEVAAAIVDWRDPDSDLTVGGAESEYYLLLSDPYECKNAPFETVEELLLVKLADRALLFGEDINRNGRLDDNENDADETDPPDDHDGELDAGLYHLVTVYSAEPNTDASGEPRINVNTAGPRELNERLGESLSGARLQAVLERITLGRPFENILDFYFRTGMKMEEFSPIADAVTTDTQQQFRGLINVNTAPAKVLSCLPGLEDSDVTSLIASRSSETAQTASIAWVAEALPQAKAVALAPYITARSYQFSADIVSIAGSGRAFRRCRIVVDAGVSPPRLIYRQDLTALGWPLDEEIRRQLRAGLSVDAVIEATGQEVF